MVRNKQCSASGKRDNIGQRPNKSQFTVFKLHFQRTSKISTQKGKKIKKMENLKALSGTGCDSTFYWSGKCFQTFQNIQHGVSGAYIASRVTSPALVPSLEASWAV